MLNPLLRGKRLCTNARQNLSSDAQQAGRLCDSFHRRYYTVTLSILEYAKQRSCFSPLPSYRRLGQAMSRLLLVEDHVLVRESIRAFLREASFEVVGEASTGVEAVQLAEELQPDLVIMDIHLPEMSGIEATRRIRQTSPNIRVLALTAYNEQAYQRALTSAGASGFVLKTAALSDLLDEIRRALSEKAKARAHEVDPAAEMPEYQLTQREHEVLTCTARGWTNKQIGAHLNISDRTVQVHLQMIYQKLNATSRTEAVSRAIALSLISPVDESNG